MTSVAGSRVRARALAHVSSQARIAALALCAVLGALVAYSAVSLQVAEQVTHVVRTPVDRVAVVNGAPREDVSFRTSDGLTLRGWLFRASGDRAVVFVHGKDSNRLWGGRFEKLAALLAPRGYSILTFDLRGHGESQGDRFSLGQFERQDVAAAVSLLASRGFSPGQVALYGESMGAGTVLQAVALSPGVGAVVADSGFADGRTVISEVGPQFTGLPTWFNPGIFVAARVLGLDVDQVRPAAVVRAHPELAYLFIACEHDGTIPPHHSVDLAAASANPGTRLWIAPGCGHVQALDRYPAEYAALLLGFLGSNVR